MGLRGILGLRSGMATADGFGLVRGLVIEGGVGPVGI